jgi:hypothetical protein
VNITLRAYEGLDDLRGMRDVVGEGLALAPARSYVHPGDVTWWLSFPPRSREALAAMAAVWERDGRIEGWVVADGEDVGSAVRPRWLDDPAADAFDDAVEGWLEVHTTSPIRYIAEDDRVQVARARRLGYGAVEDGCGCSACRSRPRRARSRRRRASVHSHPATIRPDVPR